MAKVVIDASLAVAWCYVDEHTQYTNGVLEKVGRTVDPIAPELWAYEVRNSILMGMKRGRTTLEGARTLMAFLNELDVHLSEPASHDAVFELAQAYGLTVYDAAYLDLAIRERAPLASLDDALRKAARRAGVPLFDVPQIS